MSEINNITIIYYTANKISEFFARNTQRQLLKAAGDFPIVSVSQQPMNFGKANLVVGDIGQSYINIYKQALIGAKYAKTKYIALAEDDILYSPDHFHSHTPSPGVFAYNMNVWAIYTWSKPPVFSYKDRRNLYSLICERELFIEAMQERFALYPDTNMIPLRNWSEPGKYEDNLGVTVRKSEKFFSRTPNVAFSHEKAVSFGHLGTRKKLGKNRTQLLEYWGLADNIMKLYVRP